MSPKAIQLSSESWTFCSSDSQKLYTLPETGIQLEVSEVQATCQCSVDVGLF